MTSDLDLAYGSVADLGKWLRSGAVTARRLAELALDRLDTHGSTLNAVVTVTRERALREADQADSELANEIDRGPLHGLPYGAKDLLATADYPTTWGAAPFREQHFDHDADVIVRLGTAGAVLVGKLAMVELAGGFGYEQPNAAWTGPGRSAWRPERWSGGSSSGSGSAVAAGLVPFAIGTETWGSIHCPSSFNGVTGLRPTSGRVSRGGAMVLSWTMDKIGPMARLASDCGTVLASIAGASPSDAATLGQPALSSEGPVGPYRLGLLKGAIDASAAGVAENTRRAIGVLAELGTVEEIELPDLPWDDAASIIIMCEGASAFQDFLERGDGSKLTAPEDRTGLYHALTVPAMDYLNAMRVRTQGADEMATLLSGFDALIAPAYPVTAPPAEGNFSEYFDKHPGATLSAMGNLLGLPSIAVPTGLDEEGLPTSLEILGRWWAEPTVLRIAGEFQSRSDWHNGRPPLFA